MACASADLISRARALCSEIVEIMDDAMGMSRKASATMRKQQIKAAADEIISKLCAAGLAYNDTIDVDSIGVHEENRFGSGLSAADVHELIARIIEMGWSWVECAGARAFETQTAQEARAVQERFNSVNIERANGQLAELRLADMRIVTVTCSHTIAGVRAIKHGVKSEVLKQELLTIDGNISKEKVLEYSPSMGGPIDKGVPFVIVRREVDIVIPRLAGFLQEAGNANQNAQRAVTFTQMCLQMHDRLKRGMQPEDAAKAVEAQLEWLAPDGLAVANFVQAWAGGMEPTMLFELDAFSKTLNVVRCPPGQVIAAIAKAKLAQMPEYVTMVIKALLASPEQYTSRGKSTLLNTGDISSLHTSKRGDAEIAVGYRRKAKSYLGQLVASHGMSQLESVRLIGRFDVGLIFAAHGRKCKGQKTVPTIKEAADAFLNSVPPAFAGIVELPWNKSEPDVKAVARVEPVFRDASNIVLFAGFKVSDTVQNTAKENFTIKEITAEEVRVVRNQSAESDNNKNESGGKKRKAPKEDDGEIIALSHAAFADCYTKLETKEITKLVTLPNPLMYGPAMGQTKLASAVAAMEKAWKASLKGVAVSVITTAPRSVIVQRAYKAKELKLVPFSILKLAADDGKNKVTEAVYEDGEQITIDDKPMRIVASARYDDAFIVPYWFVQSTNDFALANTEWASDETDGWTYPIIRNTHALKEGATLMAYVPALSKDAAASGVGEKGKGKGEGRGSSDVHTMGEGRGRGRGKGRGAKRKNDAGD